jgi:hypothetical protein
LATFAYSFLIPSVAFVDNYQICGDPQVLADAMAAAAARRQHQMSLQQNISLIEKIVNPELHHNITQVRTKAENIIIDAINFLN